MCNLVLNQQFDTQPYFTMSILAKELGLNYEEYTYKYLQKTRVNVEEATRQWTY